MPGKSSGHHRKCSQSRTGRNQNWFFSKGNFGWFGGGTATANELQSNYLKRKRAKLGMATNVNARPEGLPALVGRKPAESGSVENSPKVWTNILQRIFSFQAMLASLLMGGAYMGARLFIVDPDMWWHVKVGESILATHRF